MRHYNKLVRDKIPGIILDHEEEPVFRIVKGGELTHRIVMKLREELNELIAAEDPDEILKELADLYEILDTYRKDCGFTQKEVNVARKEKNDLRGAYKKGYYLIGVRKPRSEEEISKDIEQDELLEHLRTAQHNNTILTLEKK